MQGIVTVDTTEYQAFLGPIGIGDMPTFGASLRGIIGIHAHDHATIQHGFIGKHSVKFGKGSLRIDAIALALFHRNTLGSLSVFLARVGSSPRALSNMGQLFYSDEGMRVLVDKTPGNRVGGVCFQPSLSSTDRNHATGSRTSAFSLQTLAQPGVMVGSVPDVFARMEGWFSFVIGRDCKIANSNINAYNLHMLLWRWIGLFYFKGNQQVVLLMWFVVPEFGRSDFGIFFEPFEMLIIP